MKKGLVLALDGLQLEEAVELTRKLGNELHAVKLHDLFDFYGPKIIGNLAAAGANRIWIDSKVHDTKDTVGLRVKALVDNGAQIVSVHASGGIPMMKTAIKATMSDDGIARAEIYAITVLTSLDDDEIARIYGNERTREEIVHELALMAYEAGIRSIVCSAKEVGMLKQSPDLAGMMFMVPGTRSLGVELGQQKRSATPAQAVEDGADGLVIGSQVTKSDNPVEAFKAVVSEISETTK
jgi:orotidine-5'-phosphate decarboxylase